MTFEEIVKLIELFEKSSLTSLEYTKEGENLKLSRENEYAQAIPVPQLSGTDEGSKTVLSSKSPNPDPSVREICSDYVGTISLKDEKTGAPLITVGSKVKKGQLICQIEAMKMYNDVRSPINGEVLSVDAENGAVVEYGTLIARIKADEG